jgi:hypothetical protein
MSGANYKDGICPRLCALRVIPVTTGIQSFSHTWTPACAGVTVSLKLFKPFSFESYFRIFDELLIVAWIFFAKSFAACVSIE